MTNKGRGSIGPVRPGPGDFAPPAPPPSHWGLPSMSCLVTPVTGGVASESLVVDDTDLLHKGLDINQHASDECTTPSELPKTLECLPMEEDPSQDALQGPSQDALQVPTQDALQDAIRQSRKLNDNEKYELLISEQKGLADADLNTIRMV